jgi:hypothetical protein
MPKRKAATVAKDPRAVEDDRLITISPEEKAFPDIDWCEGRIIAFLPARSSEKGIR